MDQSQVRNLSGKIHAMLLPNVVNSESISELPFENIPRNHQVLIGRQPVDLDYICVVGRCAALFDDNGIGPLFGNQHGSIYNCAVVERVKQPFFERAGIFAKIGNWKIGLVLGEGARAEATDTDNRELEGEFDDDMNSTLRGRFNRNYPQWIRLALRESSGDYAYRYIIDKVNRLFQNETLVAVLYGQKEPVRSIASHIQRLLQHRDLKVYVALGVERSIPEYYLSVKRGAIYGQNYYSNFLSKVLCNLSLGKAASASSIIRGSSRVVIYNTFQHTKKNVTPQAITPSHQLSYCARSSIRPSAKACLNTIIPAISQWLANVRGSLSALESTKLRTEAHFVLTGPESLANACTSLLNWCLDNICVIKVPVSAIRTRIGSYIRSIESSIRLLESSASLTDSELLVLLYSFGCLWQVFHCTVPCSRKFDECANEIYVPQHLYDADRRSIRVEFVEQIYSFLDKMCCDIFGYSRSGVQVRALFACTVLGATLECDTLTSEVEKRIQLWAAKYYAAAISLKSYCPSIAVDRYDQREVSLQEYVRHYCSKYAKHVLLTRALLPLTSDDGYRRLSVLVKKIFDRLTGTSERMIVLHAGVLYVFNRFQMDAPKRVELDWIAEKLCDYSYVDVDYIMRQQMPAQSFRTLSQIESLIHIEQRAAIAKLNLEQLEATDTNLIWRLLLCPIPRHNNVECDQWFILASIVDNLSGFSLILALCTFVVEMRDTTFENVTLRHKREQVPSLIKKGALTYKLKLTQILIAAGLVSRPSAKYAKHGLWLPERIIMNGLTVFSEAERPIIGIPSKELIIELSGNEESLECHEYVNNSQRRAADSSCDSGSVLSNENDDDSSANFSEHRWDGQGSVCDYSSMTSRQMSTQSSQARDTAFSGYNRAEERLLGDVMKRHITAFSCESASETSNANPEIESASFSEEIDTYSELASDIQSVDCNEELTFNEGNSDIDSESTPEIFKAENSGRSRSMMPILLDASRDNCQNYNESRYYRGHSLTNDVPQINNPADISDYDRNRNKRSLECLTPPPSHNRNFTSNHITLNKSVSLSTVVADYRNVYFEADDIQKYSEETFAETVQEVFLLGNSKIGELTALVVARSIRRRLV